ncbi:manganese efflux pump [Marinilabiliaceae bacterium JC017]|nr:manganese efflux pump [Marinilabiliaceae bacterium JC017]
MELLALIIIAIALAMDSFAVSISTGIALKRIQWRTMGRISLFFALFQGLMPLIGWSLGQTFEEYIKVYDHWVAFGLLTFIGSRMVYKSLKHQSETPFINPYCHKTIFSLAIATSIDALAVGISFSMLDVEIVFPAIIIGVVTFLFAFLGLTIGVKLGSFFSTKIELFAGFLLIGIGLKILLEHTIL